MGREKCLAYRSCNIDRWAKLKSGIIYPYVNKYTFRISYVLLLLPYYLGFDSLFFVYPLCSPQEHNSYCSPSLRCTLCLLKSFLVFILKRTIQWSVYSTWNWLQNIRIFTLFSIKYTVKFNVSLICSWQKVIDLKLIYYFLNYFCLSFPVESF